MNVACLVTGQSHRLAAGRGKHDGSVAERTDAFAVGPRHHGHGLPATQAVRLGLGKSQRRDVVQRSEEHTSELQSLMRISYAVFCLKKKKNTAKRKSKLK